jgi:hypothetical protein
LQHCRNTNSKKQKILIAQTKSEEFSEEFKELLQEPIRNNSRIDVWYSINNETKTKSNVIFKKGNETGIFTGIFSAPKNTNQNPKTRK